MTDMTVQFAGANNGAASTLAEQRALFLKIFSGEVITAFESSTVTLDKHNVRTIQNGKSAQFPVLGRLSPAYYHTPGTQLTGSTHAHSERTINVDKMLIKDLFIADIDDAMSHFDVRGKYAQQLGKLLGDTYDYHIMQTLITAARTSATITGSGDDGKQIKDVNLASATEADKLQAWIDAMYAAAIELDNKKVIGPRYCLMKPEEYRFLAKAVSENGFSVLHRDYGVSGGSFSSGEIPSIAGIQPVVTPNLPQVDTSAQTADTVDEFHGLDCSDTMGIVFTPDAVGTVKLMDLSVQSEWQISYQGTLMVARYAMGHGVLQPECAVELSKAV
jgi:hypothetical protein